MLQWERTCSCTADLVLGPQAVARKAAKEGRTARDELLQALIADCEAHKDEEVVSNLQQLRSRKGAALQPWHVCSWDCCEPAAAFCSAS